MTRKIFAILVAVGCASSIAISKAQNELRVSGRDATSSRDSRAGFGKPETISGTIASVDERGVLILKREGASEPATTQLSVTETRDPNQTAPVQSEVQAAPGPGRTVYTFRITSTTQIRLNGQNKSAADLAGLQNRPATVHFIPRRSGNFATS